MLKQDISKINWRLALTNTDPKLMREELSIPATAEWVLPQLMALLASQIKLKRNASNKFSFKETLVALLGQIDRDEITFSDGTPLDKHTMKGILVYLKTTPRGCILPVAAKQCSPKWARYATGVPLFLSAFKEYRDVQYSEWDWSEPRAYIGTVLEEDYVILAGYITSGWRCPWTTEELLAFTKIAEVVKSGKTEGRVRKLGELTSFSAVGDYDFDALKDIRWLRPLLCQTWVFQPHIASKYAITNLPDIDTPAAPLRGDLDLVGSAVTNEDTRLERELWGDL